MFTAGYGMIDRPPTEAEEFDTREDAQEWLDSKIATLEPPKEDEDGEIICMWQAWIAAKQD